MNNKSLKEFYRNFFNNNYCRDLRVVYPPILFKSDNKIKQPNPSLLHSFSYPKETYDLDMPKKFYSFILNNKHRNGLGNSYYEITHYNNLASYRNKANSQPYVDRLFFDFDLEEEPRIVEVKEELKIVRSTLTGKEKVKAEKVVRNDFKDIVTSTDVLETPFNEAVKLNEYFNDLDIKTFLLFSGSKGLALNVFFNSLPITYISEISYAIASNLKRELKLSTLDLAVNKDALARLQRIPYTKHNNTLLTNQPIDPTFTFNEFLDTIKYENPKVMDLDITTYHDNKYIANLLVKYNAKFTEVYKKNEEAKDTFNKVRKSKPTKSNYYRSKYEAEYYEATDVFRDCRILAKVLLGKPVREYKNYNSYICPFHDDNIASARVYKHNFICAGCGVYYRYFGFIKAIRELETGRTLTTEEVKEEMKKIKNSKS